MSKNLYPNDPRSIEQLSVHFQRYEFVCNCGKCETGLDQDDLNLDLITFLELGRAEISYINGYDTPLNINRGCSCLEHHKSIYKKIGKPYTKDSYHLVKERGQLKIVEPACATDIHMPEGFNYDVFYNIWDKIIGRKGGVGKYKSRTMIHIDIRGFYARWTM